MKFNELNDEMNYYTRRSKETGSNAWNQDSVQKKFIEVISECNLSAEQLEAIDANMISNNATLGMSPSVNKSKDDFEVFKSEKIDALNKGKTM